MIQKPAISQIEIDLEYNKMQSIIVWYDLHISELEPNFNKIQKVLAIATIDGNSYDTTTFKSINHLCGWLIPISVSTILDSFFDITTAQISANKEIDLLKNLKLLISKQNIIISIIAQIGFSFKLNITDFCWKKFQNTYTYQTLSYLFTFPNKCYQIIYSNLTIPEYNVTITKQSLATLVNNYDQKFKINIKLLEKINIKLNQEIINEKMTLDVNQINSVPTSSTIKNRKKYLLTTN